MNTSDQKIIEACISEASRRLSGSRLVCEMARVGFFAMAVDEDLRQPDYTTIVDNK